MKSLMLVGCRVVGGLLVAGVVLGISMPMAQGGLAAWSVWVVGLGCVLTVLWVTRPGR